MSKYTTSPVNEADVTRVEVEAVNSTTPTVVTRDGIWMVNGSNPTAQGVGSNPTVSTENSIRASSSATPTVIENTSNVGPVAEVIGNNPTVSTIDTIVAGNSAVPTVVTSDDAVGGTPMVIAPESDVGGTPTAQGNNGNPTVCGDDRIGMINGATPTAHLLRVIVAAEGTANVAQYRSTVTTARSVWPPDRHLAPPQQPASAGFFMDGLIDMADVRFRLVEAVQLWPSADSFIK